jgi:hypothetical protein
VTDPYLAPCLVVLRDEFNKSGPNRDKTTDGWIGDPAHAARQSKHNPHPDTKIVHAIDVDDSGPWLHGTMEDRIQHLIAECRKSGESGLDRGRLTNIIYERRIWSASSNWAEKPYSGDNPHTEHAHIDCEESPEYEQDTRPWGLADKFGDDMPSADEVAQAVWTRALTNPMYGKGGDTRKTVDAEDFQRYPDVLHSNTQGVTKAEAAQTRQELLSANAVLEAKLDAILAAIDQMADRTDSRD